LLKIHYGVLIINHKTILYIHILLLNYNRAFLITHTVISLLHPAISIFLAGQPFFIATSLRRTLVLLNYRCSFSHITDERRDYVLLMWCGGAYNYRNARRRPLHKKCEVSRLHIAGICKHENRLPLRGKKYASAINSYKQVTPLAYKEM
jgi:hypothetical protein